MSEPEAPGSTSPPAHLLRRALGALLLLIGILAWGAGPGWLDVAASISMAMGAYVITQAVFAIFFTTLCLGLAHFWLTERTFYLYVALGAFAVCGIILSRRFSARRDNTHEERWRSRKK